MPQSPSPTEEYKIAVHGDNDRLHEEALRAACEAASVVNKAPVYRAWSTRCRPLLPLTPDCWRSTAAVLPTGSIRNDLETTGER